MREFNFVLVFLDFIASSVIFSWERGVELWTNIILLVPGSRPSAVESKFGLCRPPHKHRISELRTVELLYYICSCSHLFLFLVENVLLLQVQVSTDWGRGRGRGGPGCHGSGVVVVAWLETVRAS